MEQLVILLAFFALMYFVLIRPQQKKQKQHQEMIGSLSVDDDVVTIGGLHGTVIAMGDETVDLEVTDDVVLRFQRSAIGRVVGAEEDAAEVEVADSDTDATDT